MGTLYVVRHADAGTRGATSGPDRDRELSERGWRQAQALSDALAGAGIKRILASPYIRCMQTLAPLAERVGLVVEADDRLAEGAGFEGALDLAEEVRGKPAAICSHGDVIPDLLEALVRRGLELLDEPKWQKASTWVLERGRDGFANGRYVPPPA